LDLEKVESIIRPLIENNGFQLYDVEMIGRTLRVCIEKTEGVTVSDCVDVTRLLNPALDVDEEIVPGGSYELEVGSPGLDRKLRRPEHFLKAIGEKVIVTTAEPLSVWNTGDDYFENRRNVRGVLTDFDGNELKVVSQEGKQTRIPLNAIAKASVDFEVLTTPKPGKKVSHG
jgi:ribosome maturation factor RimP